MHFPHASRQGSNWKRFYALLVCAVISSLLLELVLPAVGSFTVIHAETLRSPVSPARAPHSDNISLSFSESLKPGALKVAPQSVISRRLAQRIPASLGAENVLVRGGAGSSSNPASPAFDLTLKPRPLGQEHSQKGDCGMNTPGATDNRARSINTRTGGESHTVTDLSFPGVCGQLGFMRSYSSLATDLYTTTLGYGWAHSLDTRLIFPDQPGGVSGQVLLKFQTANQYIFFDNGISPCNMMGKDTFRRSATHWDGRCSTAMMPTAT